MWRRRVKSAVQFHKAHPNFSCSTFKDIEHLCSDDSDQQQHHHQQQPSTPRKPSVFHRVRFANSVIRALANSPSQSPHAEPNWAPSEPNNAVAEPNCSLSEPNSAPNGVSGEPNSAPSEPISAPSEAINSPAVEPNATPSSEEAAAQSEPSISLPGAERRIVVYFTSLRVVRPTFEDCRTVRAILRGFRVSIDERDLAMDSAFLEELQGILGQPKKSKLTLPRVFIGGRYMGGAEEIRTLHEAGDLKKYVEGLPAEEPGVCEVCGGYRFILCDECSGSHKCYSEKGGFRSCTACNENGLIRCPSCLPHHFEPSDYQNKRTENEKC
ncbi:uncharacterized protein LOC132269305 [Cornus florida]|uniref:uncharacterized protein LOC132269305 n=1 Tax=Cornus florida TaxID=4283 RepID=UPI0028988A0F|nr:uncharacterized protein LOC132269305 [Cornus florida]